MPDTATIPRWWLRTAMIVWFVPVWIGAALAGATDHLWYVAAFVAGAVWFTILRAIGHAYDRSEPGA